MKQTVRMGYGAITVEDYPDQVFIRLSNGGTLAFNATDSGKLAAALTKAARRASQVSR